jgi:hypothetical protein
VVGETPNLAARLQALAEPDAVVIADGTRRLLGNLFELKDLGARDLKGLAGPARAWAALRARSVGSRFEALHTTGLTALVGQTPAHRGRWWRQLEVRIAVGPISAIGRRSLANRLLKASVDGTLCRGDRRPVSDKTQIGNLIIDGSPLRPGVFDRFGDIKFY